MGGDVGDDGQDDHRQREEPFRERAGHPFRQEYPRYRPEQHQNEYYQPHQQLVRAAAMPARNSSSAPKFDSKHPRTLIRYFAELELLLDAANIDDRQSRKEHAMRYLENEDYEIWDSLLEADANYLYGAFKQAVINSYPGAEAARKYTLDDVSRLIEKWKREGITTPQAVGEYYRDFRNITNYLIAQRRFSEMEQRRRFVMGFSQELLNRIAYKLQSAYPEVDPEDGFGMDEVYRAAISILRGSSFFRSDSDAPSVRRESPLPPVAPYTAPAARGSQAPLTTSTSVKQEDLLSAIGRLVNTLNSQVTTAVPQAPQAPAPTRYVPAAAPATQTNNPAPRQQAYGAPAFTAAAFPRRAGPSDAERCNFCGETGHFMANCPAAEHYLRTGRITRRDDGKLVLPNGMFVPRSIEGQWLKDRVDTYWQRQLGDQANVNPMPTQASATDNATSSNPATMFLSVESGARADGGSRGAFASVICEVEEEDMDTEIEFHQKQILALQAKQRTKKMVFDGVEVMKRPTRAVAPKPNSVSGARGAQPSANVAPPRTDKGKEKETTQAPETSHQRAPSPPTAQPASNEVPRASASGSNPPTHPFEKAKDANYLPPVNRNLGAAPAAKAKDPAYHSQAPIQDPKFVETVLDRSLKETHITLTFEELLSLSSDLRYRLRDKVTPRRQPAAAKHVSFAGEDEGEEVEEIVSPSALEELELETTRVAPGKYRVPDLAQVLYSAQKKVDGERKIVLQSRKESLASRAITMKVAEKSYVECILDPGSEIICMSDAVSHQLGIPYDPTVTIRMQSANGERDPTLGLARDVAFEIGDFVLLFQVHVVRSPAYDVLLGRPFDDLTSAKIENMPNEEQVCTISHPESGRAFSIPTVARGPARFTMMREDKDFHPASRI